MMKKNDLKTWIIKIYFFLTLIMFAHYRLFSLISPYWTYISFGAFVLLNFILIRDKKGTHMKSLLMIVAFFLLQLIGIMFNNGGIGSIISNVTVLLGILALKECDLTFLNEKLYKFCMYAFFALCFLNSFEVYNTFLSITKDSFNPNTIAILLLLLSIIINSLNNKKKNLLLNVITFIGIYNTNSRGALIVFVIYLLLILVFKVILSKKVIIKVILPLIIISGTLFPFLYTRMYENDITFEIPVFEKDLYTGRERIWSNLLYNLEGKYLIGVGSNISETEEVELNVHNFYLSLIVNFGLICFALYIFLIFKIMNLRNRNIEKNMLLGICCIFINGFVETSLLWLPILIFILIIFTYHKEELNEN